MKNRFRFRNNLSHIPDSHKFDSVGKIEKDENWTFQFFINLSKTGPTRMNKLEGPATDQIFCN